jgi:hypothetical protein
VAPAASGPSGSLIELGPRRIGALSRLYAFTICVARGLTYPLFVVDRAT